MFSAPSSPPTPLIRALRLDPLWLCRGEKRPELFSSFPVGFIAAHCRRRRHSSFHKLTSLNGLRSWQPWSYPRLEAYSFLGLSEGA